jgi:multiple sugar transport system ATP-binding protein
MAEVTLADITKQFGTFTAVDHLSMVIEDGKFTVLVGPSGCGKTTTLRMVAGLETATMGEIRIGDRVVNDVPPKDRNIAMVFQNYALYPHMDVFGNMAFGLKLRKTSKTEIQERVLEAAQLLGIEEKLKSKPRELSGGQRQRVAVGRAIVRKPEVFLFDEPLSNLDAKLRVQMRTELAELHSKLRTTTIYVTHDQVEAMTLGDRIAIMKDGVIQQYASPQDTYNHPNNQFVAGFIGSPGMNFFPAAATKEGDQIVLSGASFKLTLSSEQSSISLPDQVLVGIRPEDFSGSHSEEEDTIDLEVSVLEQLGHTLLIYGYLDGTQIVASVDPHTEVSLASTIRLSANTASLHVFDPTTEETIF